MSNRSKTMATRGVGSCLVFVHTSEAPSDAEWDEVLSHFRTVMKTGTGRALVYTEGAAPNTAQRAKLNALFGSAHPRIAVLTPSPLARAAGTAIRWFNPEVRIFGPDEIERALDHLEVSRAERAALTETLAALRAELGLAPKAIARR